MIVLFLRNATLMALRDFSENASCFLNLILTKVDYPFQNCAMTQALCNAHVVSNTPGVALRMKKSCNQSSSRCLAAGWPLHQKR